MVLAATFCQSKLRIRSQRRLFQSKYFEMYIYTVVCYNVSDSITCRSAIVRESDTACVPSYLRVRDVLYAACCPPVSCDHSRINLANTIHFTGSRDRHISQDRRIAGLHGWPVLAFQYVRQWTLITDILAVKHICIVVLLQHQISCRQL